MDQNAYWRMEGKKRHLQEAVITLSGVIYCRFITADSGQAAFHVLLLGGFSFTSSMRVRILGLFA